jgi:geranylgeranyl diphosphate synthase, type I
MFLGIKKRIDSELKRYIRDTDKLYSLNKVSPLLYQVIKDFISREGKRVRPILFTVGYLGFSKKNAPGLYRSALSIELMHDFMLVHDDIIDKSLTRRGKPSMHALLDTVLGKRKGAKFNGQDLAIVAGDVIYAMSLQVFLSIKEDLPRKERAFKKLIEAAVFTGSGEFIELMLGLKGIDRISENDIYKIYDYKTANYTFASPLAIGAILGGADETQVKRLFEYGMYLGRAFQIKDDILGLFSEEKEIGKSNLTDLQEAKLTILIWHAFHHSLPKARAAMKNILSKKNVALSDLQKMRDIVTDSGALDYAKKQVQRSMQLAKELLAGSRMREPFRSDLIQYAEEILTLPPSK